MNPAKADRSRLAQLTDLPNVGSAIATDLEYINIKSPQQLVGKDPVKLYNSLCSKRGVRQDPCVLDVFISITRFMAGEAPKAWWEYTAERKQMLYKASKG